MSELLTRIRHELENAREKTRLLEQEIRDQKRINEALKYVTSVVLHEVKWPLDSAREVLQRMQRALSEDDRPAVERAAELISQQLAQLDYIVARLDPAFELAGSHEVAVRLHSLVRNVFDTVTAVTGFAVRLVNSVPEDFPELHCDQRKLQEILINLVENAVRHIGNGDRMDLRAMDAGDQVLLQIEDNGDGMRPEIRQALREGDFDRVVKVNRQLGRRGGLGLAIVQRLVRELGGQLRFPDRSGGTLVEIQLPRFASDKEQEELLDAGRASTVDAGILVPRVDDARPPAPGLEDAPDSVPLDEAVRLPVSPESRGNDYSSSPKRRNAGERPRILLIDDDQELTRYLAEGFPRQEFEVEIAADGPHGLIRAEEIQPDLVVLDVLMIGMNGFEVLTRLKAGPATRDIPVVMLSNVRGEAKALKLGAAAYLQKPVTAEVLVQLARRLLGC